MAVRLMYLRNAGPAEALKMLNKWSNRGMRVHRINQNARIFSQLHLARMEHISLMLYIPIPRVKHAAPGPNTANMSYEYRGITQIASDPMPTSPPRAIKDKLSLNIHLRDYILPRIRRALRRDFEQLAPQFQLTPIAFDGGLAADLVLDFKPDMAFIAVNSTVGSGKNRCPGDLKVSWKWKSEWRESLILLEQDARSKRPPNLAVNETTPNVL
ncbi:hypothetical protein FQN52_000713 [Onygenales sp. PD_12]|nr:hypothetical protein FQN52_000713 [Onygenales sp. PD_12]